MRRFFPLPCATLLMCATLLLFGAAAFAHADETSPKAAAAPTAHQSKEAVRVTFSIGGIT